MYSFISGKVVEKNPAYVVLENQGIGYYINITLNTFEAIGDAVEVKLYVHLAVREDAHTLYGFFEERERELFLLLQTVPGVGYSTARLILSSLTVRETINAIADSNLKVIQGVKGIGAKTAQRIVVDLRDKVGKISGIEDNLSQTHNNLKDEALYALTALGFGKAAVEKVIDKLIQQAPDSTVEQLVKNALRIL